MTTGTVAAVNVTVTVKCGSTCGGGRGMGTFADQVRITPGGFSDGGDSASLTLNPVGLLFAGSSTSHPRHPRSTMYEDGHVSARSARPTRRAT